RGGRSHSDRAHATASVNSASENGAHSFNDAILCASCAGSCILVIHLLIKLKLTYYLPESIAVVLWRTNWPVIMQLIGNWRKEEGIPPMIFFLVILPPIIFESGYNLHKGNFFHNIGSILLFAILGTLTLVESFAFGSLISAVDPVATLAIFQAIKVDPILYMWCLARVFLMMRSPLRRTSRSCLAVLNFFKTFLCSAGIGTMFALGLRTATQMGGLATPSLEVGIMAHIQLCAPTAWLRLAMSGIMPSLFAHSHPSLVIWCIALCLLGRAFNIFPVELLFELLRFSTRLR
uniref:Sodium/hydrogen exchanger 8 n=1 Tax=Macrostomum lignano TaxID=282301 RepID=A0A1I8FHB4_9PLAT